MRRPFEIALALGVCAEKPERRILGNDGKILGQQIRFEILDTGSFGTEISDNGALWQRIIKAYNASGVVNIYSS